MIFGINTTSDISKLLYVISQAIRWRKLIWCQISRTNHALICLYYYPQKVCNFTWRYLKLNRNTTALSQSNCKNFSCGSINIEIYARQNYKPSLCKGRTRTNAGTTFYSVHVSFFWQPQNSVPDIIIWMISGSTRIAYHRIPAYKVLFSPREEACGQYCGQTIEIEMKVLLQSVFTHVTSTYANLLTQKEAFT